MPNAAPKPCKQPGCRALTTSGAYCESHAKLRVKQADAQRESSTQRGYGYRWQKTRDGFLRKHPLCVYCLSHGQVIPATIVDHIEPHRGDMKKFWDRDNWQSLCKTCHDSYKQRLEKSGTEIGCNLGGFPIDKNHHWNR